jgi:hypothetical protein
MTVNAATLASLLAVAFCVAPRDGKAQTQIGAAELTRARSLLQLSRAEFSAEQFALLSGRLAAAESAYAELTTVARAGQAAAAVTQGGAAAGAEATAATGRSLLGGAAELLPLLLLVWPATAHAPGVKQEAPEVRAVRSKVEESLKALADAARQVESERKAAAAGTPKPTLERCLQACEDGGEARKAFCRSLPDKTPAQRRDRNLCWESILQSIQYCKNTCYAILGH